MADTKKGCYHAFCAEHKHLGLSAIELMRNFQECDIDEAQRIKRKWHGKLKETAYARFCKEMKGHGHSGPQLAKLFGESKKKTCVPIAKKNPSTTFNTQKRIGRLTFSTTEIDMLRAITQLKDMESSSNATGYRHIIWDNRARYAHAPYSYSIKIGTHYVRSKGFATAELAANALFAQIGEWLTDIDCTSPEQVSEKHTTFPIPKPPEGWSIAEGDIIMVDIEDIGWTEAAVKRTFDDGWFVARIVVTHRGVTHDSWDDWFNWQEEGKDWKRQGFFLELPEFSSSPTSAAPKPVSAAKRCSLCRKPKGVCHKRGYPGHLALLHEAVVAVAEPDYVDYEFVDTEMEVEKVHMDAIVKLQQVVDESTKRLEEIRPCYVPTSPSYSPTSPSYDPTSS